MGNKINKIEEATKLIGNLTLNDLKEEELIVVITKLRISLDDMFGIIKSRTNLTVPFVLGE